MTLKQFLNTLDHEVWVRVRPHHLGHAKSDIVLWSADWIGGSGYPDEVEKYLECEVDDLSAELHPDPEGVEALAPMLVVYAYVYAKPVPVEVFVLEKTTVLRNGFRSFWCRVFLDEECAKAALRDDYNSEIDASEKAPDYSRPFLLDDSASLVFPEGVEIRWETHVKKTADNDYR